MISSYQIDQMAGRAAHETYLEDAAMYRSLRASGALTPTRRVSLHLLESLGTMLIGLGGLHHSVAGTVEILMGVFSGEVEDSASYFVFLLWSVIGNAFGGVVFVAGLKYSHIMKSSE